MQNIRYHFIDLLRFLAAITVSITHLTSQIKGPSLNFEIISSMAVEIFFIISGFVLAPQIINLVKNKSFYNYKIFLIRRWYRTIPLYILSLLLTSIILGKLFSIDFLKYLLFIQNLLFLSISNEYFSIAWSLSVEEWFYIIFPLFLILILRNFSHDKNNYIVIGSIVFITIITICRIYFSDLEQWGSNVRRIVIFRLDAIVYGFLLFIFINKMHKNLNNIYLLILSFIVLTIICFSVFHLNVSKNFYYLKIFSHYLIAMWGSILLILFFNLDKIFKSRLIYKINLFLGKISYSIYLFHLIIIYIIGLNKNLSFFAYFIIFIIVQIGVSTLLYYFFEEPILNSRPKYK